MEHYYKDYHEGYLNDHGYYHRGDWCEICGDPHYTRDCYYSSGYPTYQYGEPYPYSQSYEVPDIAPSQAEPSPEEIELCKQILDSYSSSIIDNKQGIERLQAHMTEFDELDPHSQPFDDPSIPPFQPEPSPTIFEMLTQILDSYSSSIISHAESSTQMEIRLQESTVRAREYEEQLRRLEAQSIVINELCANYQRESIPCNTNQSIFWDDEDENEAQASSSLVVLEKTIEPETLMDNVQTLTPPNIVQVPTPVHYISPWEDEFGDELLGIPLMELKEEGFDPVGDLDELEALLYGEMTVEIKEEPHQEMELQVKEFTNEQMTMVTSNSPLCIKDSRTMDEHNGGSPPKSKPPRERAWNKAGPPKLKAWRWSNEHHENIITCRNDRLLHYMSCIKFGPGKFKCWWHDPFNIF